MRRTATASLVVIACATIAYAVLRPSNETILMRLESAKKIYLRQEHPKRGSRFCELMDAYRKYVGRHPHATNKDNALLWLGNPDDEWSDTTDSNDIALVYFYDCAGREKCAFFVGWNKSRDRLTGVTPATFSGTVGQNLPNKAL